MSLFHSLTGNTSTPILGSPVESFPTANTIVTVNQQAEQKAFRSRFLSLSTWAGATATDLELQYAIYHWHPGQTPESAVETLKRRRGAVAAGEVRKLFRAQAESGEQDG